MVCAGSTLSVTFTVVVVVAEFWNEKMICALYCPTESVFCCTETVMFPLAAPLLGEIWSQPVPLT